MPTRHFSTYEVEQSVQVPGINPGPCPHCGGELGWKASVASTLESGLETHFFQCERCGHIHTVEKKH